MKEIEVSEEVYAALQRLATGFNQARQIDGTQYWAIMNNDTATKRRFLARVLEFIGYRDETIEFACAALGGRTPVRRVAS